MQIELELLAPAKNKSIGIAAIDCGADAVYIAGPRFGAREAAGNTLADIAELVDYAHKFGAKVSARMDNAAPPRVSPSSLVRITPVISSFSLKLSATFTAS